MAVSYFDALYKMFSINFKKFIRIVELDRTNKKSHERDTTLITIG